MSSTYRTGGAVMSGDRRVVVHPNHAAFVEGYKRAVRDLRAEMGAAHYRTLTELKRLQIEITQMHAELTTLRQLRAVVARQHAERELAELHRQRSLTEAWKTERDPAAPLQ
jgi:hypothetical protein